MIFLDDASRFSGEVDRKQAEKAALTLFATLRKLKKANKKLSLNTARPIAQYQVSDNWNLQMILGGKPFQLEWDFIRTLNDRSPFSADLGMGLLEEARSMDFRTAINMVSSDALAWAALLDSATVSFDAHPDWAEAWVASSYAELDGEGNLHDAEMQVRNASKAEHADQHGDWLRALGETPLDNAAKIWDEKAEIFPGLRFLPRVEKDLIELEGTGVPFQQAVTALKCLAKDVGSWAVGNAWPEFSTKASPEGQQRQNLCYVVDHVTNKSELFDWHTRFTGGIAGRVHFRVDGTGRQIVVAYIGSKLQKPISS